MRCFRAHRIADHVPGSWWGELGCWIYGRHLWPWAPQPWGTVKVCKCCGRQERSGIISSGTGIVPKRTWVGDFS